MVGTKGDIALAEGILARLEALSDPDDQSMCGVDPKHKEAVRLYLQSWVIPPAEALVGHLRDGDRIEDYHIRDAHEVRRRRAMAVALRESADA